MTYGVNAPQGLQPYSYLNGQTFNGQPNEYILNGNVAGGGTSYGTTIYSGDAVTLLSDGTIGKVTLTTQAIVGVFNGVKWYDNTNTLQRADYWAAGTPVYGLKNPTVFVIDDPWVLWTIQALNSAGAAPITGSVNTINMNGTVSDLNWNYSLGFAAGNNISGNSGNFLDLSTQAATATLQLKLIHLTPAVNNTFGLPFNNGLVLINNHIYKGGTGTAGV